MPQPREIIRTKLHAPFVRREQVARLRLQAQVERGLQGPLTLITAPAGFGKTTLAAASIAQNRRKAAWFSLDKNDNQIESFLACLIAALQAADTRIGIEASSLLSAGQIVSPRAVLTSLVNDLDEIGDDIILVLDDYQFIDSPAVHEAAAFLIERAPACFHLLVASRSDPPLPVARLRSRGQAVELRLGDLRFSPAEAAQFLNGVMGLGLDAASVTALEDRTEGWIAGLQMAALSLRDRTDAKAFIKSFSGTNRYILDYLMEEVLASQPEEVQHFLLATSVLERMSAPLCAALIGRPAGGEGEPGLPQEWEALLPTEAYRMLKRLEKANLFLIPLDDEGVWFRYHHLFADLLRLRLEQAFPGRANGLHLRAADWYEQNGLIIEAIQHASAAADDELVERLIDRHYFDMMNRGEMFWVRFWTGNLSKDLVYRRPWLCLYEALNHSWFGQLEKARQILGEAEKLVQAEALAKGETPDTCAMRAYAYYVKSRITAMGGDLQAAIELCQAARRAAAPDNLTLQIDFCITLGFEYFLLGDFENAKILLNEMIGFGARLQAVNNPVAGFCLLARIAVYRGQLRQAGEYLQKAFQLIQEPGAQYLGVFGLVEVERARLLYRRGELEQASQHASAGLEKLPFWGKADDTCLALTLLWKIHRLLGQPETAEEYLARAVQLVQTQGVFSEARREVEALRSFSQLESGDEAARSAWGQQHPAGTRGDDPFGFQTEADGLAQARVLIELSRHTGALGLLSSLEEGMRVHGRHGRLPEAWLLQSLALELKGERLQALARLLHACEAASCLEDWGGFFDFLACLGEAGVYPGEARRAAVSLLAQAPVQNCPERLQALVQALIEGRPWADVLPGAKEAPLSVADRPADRPGERPAPIGPLSPREMEVLSLIAEGKTNPEIARLLVIAPGTVKAHTASIYRKLEVANRTEAVSRAHQLGIWG